MTTLTREERLQNQKGKYIVTTYSHKRGCMLYLQDPTLTYNPKFIWTAYKSNAKTFDSIQEVNDYAKQHQLINYVTEMC